MTILQQLQATRSASDGFYETVLARDEGEELFLTATPLAGEGIEALLARSARHLRQRPWHVVGMTVFSGTRYSKDARELLGAAFSHVDWPVTWLECEGDVGLAPAGLEVHALRGTEVRTIRVRDRIVGCTWEDGAARHCELGGLYDEQAGHTPSEQTQQVLNDMVSALRQANMEFRHVYRTWFRNRDILGWYDDFNRVRTAFFNRARVFDGLLPASTGIGACNAADAELVAGLWAMNPKSPDIRARTINSPLQHSATDYGSSFSRAVEVDLGGQRRLTISGTASIDADGKTVYPGEVTAQVNLTMKVVSAILNSRGMDWIHVTRGAAYFRRPADMGAYQHWRQANRVQAMPVIVSHHTVCRDDLLYEIEIDAVSDPV
jgi:enamine deaminase RidA (YjgF/YER057c/UK114 family)